MLLLIVKKRNIGRVFALTLFVTVFAVICSLLSTAPVLAENQSVYSILIYIEEKKLYLFENGECISSYPIASGMPDWPSPIGQWEIVEMGRWGNAYGGRWLGLNVPWGQYGIHGTSKESSIGQSASHGCIRMYNRDIRELYDFVRVGTQVVIRYGSYGPFGTGFRELVPGDRGADVLAVQQRLKKMGYFRGAVNGIYEDDLKEALYDFQRNMRLTVKYTITEEDYLAMGFTEFE